MPVDAQKTTRTLSCGVLVLNERRELLLCHVTGTAWWDIPKGAREPGETPLEAACRETEEETGIVLAPERLLDLGEFAYRPDKALHLFATHRMSTQLDPARCVCRSHFAHRLTGTPTPEVDAFAWVSFEEVAERCARRMGELLTRRLSLDALAVAAASLDTPR